MKNAPLVSIVTPCYNGGRYVHRFLDSVLAQTYQNIELIFVNDGSTDNSEEVVFAYREKFKKAGTKLIYIYQENKGLSGAINTGLLKVTGEYFCWPDSDDYLEPTSVEKRVRVLETHTDYAVVTSDAYIRNTDDIKHPIGLVSSSFPKNSECWQFELLLKSESIFCSGCHMMCTDVFRETHPKYQIFNARRGQNWQILLPVYHKYKRYFLKEPLYNYIKYSNSMSVDDSKSKKLFRFDEHKEIILNTLNGIEMPVSKRCHYINMVAVHYAKKKLRIAYEYRDKRLFNEQFTVLRKFKYLGLKEMILYLSHSNVLLYRIAKIFRA